VDHVSSLTGASDEPYFRVRHTREGVVTSGSVAFRRGHFIPRSDGRPADGIFAEWQWDGDRLAARTDRYGVGPLFYARTEDGVTLSPSLLTLLEQGIPADFDTAALAVFLRLGFFIGEDTPFASIRILPPDGRLEWQGGRCSVTGGLPVTPAQPVNRAQALAGFASLFRQAMSRRLPADDRAVLPLSGGRDSRHILFELCALGRPPRCAVTIPRYPPRPHEDERLAPIVAAAAGVPHVLLDQDDRRFPAEVEKNWGTHLCADEHAWYMTMLRSLRSASAVYDGLGGALSVPNRFLSRQTLDLFERGRNEDLARQLLDGFALFDERFLAGAVSPAYRQEVSRDRAVERLATELGRHAAAPDPVKSFNFWNRIRRELSLVPYALMREVPAVYTPYLDHDVYDFLMGLPPWIMTPNLESADKSFHSDAINLAFPEHAAIPFEDKAAPAVDSGAHDSRFGMDVAQYVMRNAGVPRRMLNGAYVFPRLMRGMLSPAYRRSHRWLPALTLYLFQLDAAAAGLARSQALVPRASRTPAVDLFARVPHGKPATAA
jgi:asparagine synthase (glutamine-hydrolysing)